MTTRTTTRSAAECARIAHLTGTLETGKRADILAVDGDPLSDIKLLQNRERLALIVRDGKTYKTIDSRWICSGE